METPEFKAYTAKSNLIPGYMNTKDFTESFGKTVDYNIKMMGK